jgi:hypothetical protein
MNNKLFTQLISCSALIMLSCSNEEAVSPDSTPSNQEAVISTASPQAKAGATQISGIGFYAEIAECDFPDQGADYAVRMTGDLEGCLYVFVDDYACSPSGTYRELGREYFVGTYKGAAGTFWTNYKFESKFEGCAEDGSPLGAEIFGRCQHPIAKGSGDGVFSGVTGRLDMKDDIEAGNFPYRGHLKF